MTETRRCCYCRRLLHLQAGQWLDDDDSPRCPEPPGRHMPEPA